MNRSRAWRVAWFAALGVAALAVGAWFAEHTRGRATVAGERLADFRLPDVDGRLRSLAEWDGKALLVNFWAPWCAPCREELPLFAAAQREQRGNGLQVLAIGIDNARAIGVFMEQVEFNFPSLVAETEGVALMARYGNDGALPFTLAVDRDRNVVGKRIGKITRAQIDAFAARSLE